MTHIARNMIIKNVKRIALATASFAILAGAAHAQTSTVMSEIVYFNFDKAEQSVETAQQLERLRSAVASCSGAQSISLVGHTDTSGSAAYNLGLSQRRAAEMKEELIKLGVPANIISTSGMGETQTFIPTGDGVKEALNRRVEMTLSQDASCFAAPTETYTEYVEPTETYTEYVEPAETYTEYVEPTETFTEYVETPTVEYVEPVQEVTVYNPPATPVQPAPVVTAPAPTPVATPTIGGGSLATPNLALLAAGIGAVAAVGIIASDDNEDDDAVAPTSP